MIALLDFRMKDGSRHFAELPQTRLWDDVRDHVSSLAGARLTGFVCDYVTQAWIDFTYCGQSFSINDQLGDYWFFVSDPTCPADLLTDVGAHFARLLSPSVCEDAGK
jgi:hypothetical protein